MKKTGFILTSLVLSVCLYLGIVPDTEGDQGSAPPISHNSWDELLQQHVSESGNVSYKGFMADSVKLDEYLDLLSANHPNDTWGREEQLAYWINAYNAFTVKVVLDNYPLESIRDITFISIPFVHSVWDLKFIKIGKKTYDLNNIEHSILRKKFDEPRIHFAINCASVSCPKLLNRAYSAEKLEEQLQAQTVEFINDPDKNKLSANRLEVSKIFSWFKGDFTKKGDLVDFFRQYATVAIEQGAKVDYLPYDWNLNE